MKKILASIKKFLFSPSSLKKEQVFLGIFFVTVLMISTPFLANAQSATPDRSDGTAVSETSSTPDQNQGGIDNTNTDNGTIFSRALERFLGLLAKLSLELSALLLGLSGLLLNGVIYYTIIKMAENYGSITAIADTWGLIRDLANMSFIFILLFAAIKTILGVGGDNKRLIINLVIAAILINFSMLFTEIIIDAGNIIAVLLYDLIAPGAISQAGNGFDAAYPGRVGLSDSFMRYLNLTSLYELGDQDRLGIGKVITVGVFGSLLMLIAAFCFLAIAIMLIIRYAILMLLLIFSPIAALGQITPGLSKKFNEWWNTLLGQTFFAPIFFFLTLVTLHLLGGITQSAFGINAANSSNTALSGIAFSRDTGIQGATGFIPLLLSYSVVIIFMVTSIIVAKNWADKSAYGIKSATKWAMGAAGAGSLGLAGFAGRQTVGRMADARANNQDLKDRAAENSWAGKRARLQLAAARKTASSSFDLRATKVGSATVGAAGAGKGAGKGGFSEFKKKQAEAAVKRAGSLAPGDEVIDKAEQNLARVKTLDHTTDKFKNEHREAFVAQGRVLREKEEKLNLQREKYAEYQASVRDGNLKADPELVKKYREGIDSLEKEVAADQKKKTSMNTAEGYKSVKIEEAQAKVDDLKGVDDNRAKEILRTQGIENPSKDQIARIKKENKSAADRRKQSYANVMEKSFWGKTMGYNTAAAAQIRKGKSEKDKLADAAKKLLKEDEEAGESTKPKTEEAPQASSGEAPSANPPSAS